PPAGRPAAPARPGDHLFKAVRRPGPGAEGTDRGDSQALTGPSPMAISSKALRLAPVLLLIAVLLIWEILCRALQVSEFIFPAPSAIVMALIEFSEVIAMHAWRTFWTTMVGFGIAILVGVLLGFLIGSSKLAYAAVYPLMTAF